MDIVWYTLQILLTENYPEIESNMDEYSKVSDEVFEYVLNMSYYSNSKVITTLCKC